MRTLICSLAVCLVLVISASTAGAIVDCELQFLSSTSPNFESQLLTAYRRALSRSFSRLVQASDLEAIVAGRDPFTVSSSGPSDKGHVTAALEQIRKVFARAPEARREFLLDEMRRIAREELTARTAVEVDRSKAREDRESSEPAIFTIEKRHQPDVHRGFSALGRVFIHYWEERPGASYPGQFTEMFLALVDVATRSIVWRHHARDLGTVHSLSPDGKFAALKKDFYDEKREIHAVLAVHDASTFVRLGGEVKFPPDTSAVAVSPDGKLLAGGGRLINKSSFPTPIRIVDTAGNEFVHEDFTSDLSAMVFTDPGTLVVATGVNQGLGLFRIKVPVGGAKPVIETVVEPLASGKDDLPAPLFLDEKWFVRALVLSGPMGRVPMTHITIHDPVSGRLLHELKRPLGYPGHFSISADGRYVAIRVNGGIWFEDLITGESRGCPLKREPTAFSFADGRFLVATYRGGKGPIEVWDVKRILEGYLLH